MYIKVGLIVYDIVSIKLINIGRCALVQWLGDIDLKFTLQELSEVSADDIAKAAELDETASYVHISEESKRKVAEIPNVIGDSICSLCKVKFEDIFKLAMHKCPRIVHEEYKCPECDKVCLFFIKIKSF